MQQKGIGLGILPSRMGTGSSGAGKGSGGQAGAWEWDGRGIQHQDWRFSFVLLFFLWSFLEKQKKTERRPRGPSFVHIPWQMPRLISDGSEITKVFGAA